MTATQQDLSFPIGKFHLPQTIAPDERQTWIGEVERLPADLAKATTGLTDAQLDTEYRPGGWTVRQVVHHLADSHMNSYARFRLALTEPSPTIKAYAEAAWAELPDAKSAPIELSLELLRGLHARWVMLLKSMSDAGFAKTFRHPERGEMRLDSALTLYAWHGRHHLAHLTGLHGRRAS